MPVLECATDFAAMSARLSASGEPMSGLGAPLRTARPMPERARSTRLPATTLPSLIRPSIASAVRMARSPPAPVSSSFRRPFAEPQVITALVPMVRSKSGARSSITVFRPLVQSTRIAAFLSHFPQSYLRANSPRRQPLTPVVDARREKMPLLCRQREGDAAHAGGAACGGQDGTMDSESARMSSAAEARYRIDYPNSKPRVVKVVALDAASEHVVKRVAERQWQRATFFTSLKFDGAPTQADEPDSGRVSGVRTMELPRWPLTPLASTAGGEGSKMQAWLSDLAGRTKALVEEVASADLVVMVSSAGTSAQAAAVIGEACAVRKVMTMALIIGSEERSNDELSKTLATLRPYASMLVIASGDEYIEEMLSALRA